VKLGEYFMAKREVGAKPASTAVKKPKVLKDRLPPECLYDLNVEGKTQKMAVKCKECKGKHSLTENTCLARFINAYAKETSIESVTLSHYVETEYYGHSIELLTRMVQFGNELDNLALRDPAAEYFDSTTARDQKRLRCNTCTLNPRRIFPQFKKVFLTDIMLFYSAFTNVVNKVAQADYKSKQCQTCTDTTIEDLNYLYDSFTELARYIVRVGFNIVLGKPPEDLRTIYQSYDTRPVYIASQPTTAASTAQTGGQQQLQSLYYQLRDQLMKSFPTVYQASVQASSSPQPQITSKTCQACGTVLAGNATQCSNCGVRV
jgi:hypothetical protein